MLKSEIAKMIDHTLLKPAKKGQIELQGDHKVRVKEVLSEMGFSSDTIEIRDSDKKYNKRRRR